MDALLADPLIQKDSFYVPRESGGVSLATSLVSCTGAQFCGLALAETKVCDGDGRGGGDGRKKRPFHFLPTSAGAGAAASVAGMAWTVSPTEDEAAAAAAAGGRGRTGTGLAGLGLGWAGRRRWAGPLRHLAGISLGERDG